MPPLRHFVPFVHSLLFRPLFSTMTTLTAALAFSHRAA